MPRPAPNAPVRAALAAVLATAVAAPPARGWEFVNVTAYAGLMFEHKVSPGGDPSARLIHGGVAAGDYNRDGWIDLYTVGGNLMPNRLFRNEGDGSFTDVAPAAGVAVTGALGSGPTFADIDGDGWEDLVIGGIEGTGPRFFRNDGDGTFTDVSASTHITTIDHVFGSALGDYDADGDLDLCFTRWGSLEGSPHLYRNDGGFGFFDADKDADLDVLGDGLFDYTFTANFTDIDGDGRPDLLFASDFLTSSVHRNDGDGTFTEITDPQITDENGMGAALGDYDADGDLDWFVSSIWDPTAPSPALSPATVGSTGNRLYRNEGGGVFADVTGEAGVRAGYWGWGSSFADFDNDGVLDLVHVNGWSTPWYQYDPVRLFLGAGDGTFTEEAAGRGIDDVNQGRGVVCFDYDRDGDIDVFIANNNQFPRLFRNDGGHLAGNWLTVALRGAPPNTAGVGARIRVTAGGTPRLEEIRCGSNFVSQNPAEAHFGLGPAGTVDELRVSWPGGGETVIAGVAVNQRVVVDETGQLAAPAPGPPPSLRAVPNPFARSTRIRGGGGPIRILDAAGRTVRRLSGTGDGGVVWDGRDDRGREAPPGVYFVREVHGPGPGLKLVRRVP